MAKTDLTPEEAQATALGDYKFGFHDDVDIRSSAPAEG